MKLFTVILSFIVFSQLVYLNCAMPVSDVFEDEKVEYCSHSDQENDHENESHNCSPFCMYDCCSSPVYLSYHVFIDNVLSENEIAYFSHLNNYTYSFGLKLYHPPRI